MKHASKVIRKKLQLSKRLLVRTPSANAKNRLELVRQLHKVIKTRRAAGRKVDKPWTQNKVNIIKKTMEQDYADKHDGATLRWGDGFVGLKFCASAGWLRQQMRWALQVNPANKRNSRGMNDGAQGNCLAYFADDCQLKFKDC